MRWVFVDVGNQASMLPPAGTPGGEADRQVQRLVM